MINDDLKIIHYLDTAYGIAVTKLIPLDLGADINACVYQAIAPNESYFVKLKQGHHHDISLDIVALLHQAGIKQIIAPIQTIEGTSSQAMGDFTMIVYPFIKGKDGFHQALTNEQWLTFGQALRQVHHLNVPPSIQQRLRRETYLPKWQEAVRTLYTHIETQPKPKSDEIGQNLMVFMQKNATTIQQLVNRAEQLGNEIKTQSPPFVLCHSDIHGGNVLISDNGTLYMVDWDEPIMAPKERDLMFIGGGVANVWNKPNEAALFYQGYGKADINQTILSYYRHERIVEDIAVYGQALLLTTKGNNRATMLHHFMAMFAPNGVVDIAYQTNSLQ
jgi:spectinomycin phosphotransferase